MNLIELFKYNKQELGVVIALLARGPSIVPPIVTQLGAEGGGLGAAVLESYAKADAELQAVAATTGRKK